MVKLWVVIYVLVGGVPVVEQTYSNRELFKDVAACEQRFVDDRPGLEATVRDQLSDGMTFEMKHHCEVQGQPA